MQPPAVQTLDEILASLQPGYQAQEEIFNRQIAAAPGQAQSRKSGLEATKVNAFRDINRGANASGNAFSGVPIEEQTRYLGEKYLPGLQAIDEETTQRQDALSMALAQLGTEKRNLALTTRQGQEKARDEYIARELEYQRQREAEERERAFQRSQSAAKDNRPVQARDEMAGLLSGNAGGDGKVSPETYKRGKAQWVAQGFNAADYDTYFRSFVNESHAWDYGFGSKPGTNKPKTATPQQLGVSNWRDVRF